MKRQQTKTGQTGTKQRDPGKHCFDVAVAADVGVNAAIVFEHLRFWIEHNRKTGRNLKDGEHWTYGTQKSLAEQFDYLTVKQVRTALEKLEAGGYIKTAAYNRHGYDRTRWYGLAEKGKTASPGGELQAPTGAKGAPEKAEGNAPAGRPIPDVNQRYLNDSYIQKARALAESCGAVCNL